jgi:hypothetical protein
MGHPLNVPSVLPPALGPVTDRPRGTGDSHFWQFPCRTEGSAFDLHHELAEAPVIAGAAQVYLGLPWATWIDRHRVDAVQMDAREECFVQRGRIRRLRSALQAEQGVGLSVHTVCQHVGWRDWLPHWLAMGITDAWLSHAPSAIALPEAPGLRLHPWRLFAVNVEDDTRRGGLDIGRDPADKPVLASFIGAHADHYLSDVRLKLRTLAETPGFVIRVTDRWHFEDIVYGHQVAGSAAGDQLDDSVAEYNRVLSNSRFSLCPAGAGANTLRLWESLAAGAVPVLLGPPPQLPRGGSLRAIDWEAIVMRPPDNHLEDLPRWLRAVPIEEVRRRQHAGMIAFADVRAQRCFSNA